MHKYIVELGDYDSCGRLTVLESRRKLSDKQLEEKVHEATRKALEHAVRNPEHFCWDAAGHGIKIGELYPRIIDEMEKLGFTSQKYRSEWRGLAYTYLTSADNHEQAEARTPKMKRLYDSLPRTLLEKAKRISEKYVNDQPVTRMPRRTRKNKKY